MSKFQAVMFNKKRYSTEQARKFLAQYKLKPIKRVRITKNYDRYRLKEPNEKIHIYRTKTLKQEVMAIVEI